MGSSDNRIDAVDQDRVSVSRTEDRTIFESIGLQRWQKAPLNSSLLKVLVSSQMEPAKTCSFTAPLWKTQDLKNFEKDNVSRTMSDRDPRDPALKMYGWFEDRQFLHELHVA